MVHGRGLDGAVEGCQLAASRLQNLEEAGHLANLDRPEIFDQLVIEFLHYPPGHDRLLYEQECEMSPGSDGLDRLSVTDTDSEENSTMIFNPPPSLLRILTQPEDSANMTPNEMAAWWMEGRAESTQPVDSANSDSKSLAVRLARLRWPRLRRTGKAKSGATPDCA
jgi:hypothetical protein